jgi:hypothetical protein
MLLFDPPWLILATATVILVVGVIMDRLIEPRLSGDAAVHPILTVLALMILGEASGVLGMVIALPLAALFQTVLREVVLVSVSPPSAIGAETAQIVDLQAQIERLRAELPDGPHRLEAQGILARLEALMAQTEVLVHQHHHLAERGHLVHATRTHGPAMVQRTHR